jgi:hypothetical protein
MRRLVVLAALALAACGGGVSRADYIAKADAFCASDKAGAKERNQRLQAANRGSGTAGARLAKLAPLLDESIAWERSRQREFRKLESPESDRDTIHELQALGDQTMSRLEDAAAAAHSGDAKRFVAASLQERALGDRTNTLFRDYGFKVCGSTRGE